MVILGCVAIQVADYTAEQFSDRKTLFRQDDSAVRIAL
jgi:hypothetical protein